MNACKVKIDGERRVNILRKAGEEWDLTCIAPQVGWRLDIMIWRCITNNGVSTLCVVDGNINAQKYIEIIDNHLWPVFAAHFPSYDYLFQDGNALAHGPGLRKKVWNKRIFQQWNGLLKAKTWISLKTVGKNFNRNCVQNLRTAKTWKRRYDRYGKISILTSFRTFTRAFHA